MAISYTQKVYVGGHRGDCHNYYENTMPAFEGAIKAGVNMIELDVRLSKDNVLMVIHDATVDRTTNSSGNVSDMTASELLSLNAGDEKEPAQIPVFSEFMEWASTKNISDILNKEYYDYLLSNNICPWTGANVTQKSKLSLACQYGARVITVNNPYDAIIKLKELNEI